MSLESIIESILFYKNEPVKIQKFCDLLDRGEEEVKEALGKLAENLAERGISLVEAGDTYMFATSPDSGEMIDKIAKEELSRDLGKAGLETLSIILYKGAVTRREIDYIRGVNSTFILRSLLSRGLVEREEGKEDGRIFIYKPTLALLAHLGIKKVEELPEYDKIREEIKENQLENV